MAILQASRSTLPSAVTEKVHCVPSRTVASSFPSGDRTVNSVAFAMLAPRRSNASIMDRRPPNGSRGIRPAPNPRPMLFHLMPVDATSIAHAISISPTGSGWLLHPRLSREWTNRLLVTDRLTSEAVAMRVIHDRKNGFPPTELSLPRGTRRSRGNRGFRLAEVKRVGCPLWLPFSCKSGCIGIT